MPESEIKIKVDAQQAKQTFKDLKQSVASVETQTRKFSTGSPMSAKAVDAAASAYNRLKTSQKQSLDTISQLSKAYAAAGKEVEKLQKTQDKFWKYWNTQKSKRMQEKISAAQQAQAELGAVHGGFREQYSTGQLRGRELRQGILARRQQMEEGEGIMGRLGGRIAGAIGIGTSIYLGKKALDAADRINTSLIEMSGVLPARGGELSELMNEMTVRSATKTRFAQMQRLGITAQEVAELGGQFAATGGNVTAEHLFRAMSYKRLGIGTEQWTGLMRTQARGGRLVEMSGKDMLSIMTEATKTGLQDARKGEFIDSVKDISNTLQRQGVASPEVTQISGLLNAIGATKNPLFQGIRGGDVLEQINQGMTQPGGGIGGQMFMLRAAGYGSGKSWYQAHVALSQGLQNPETFSRAMQQTRGFGKIGGALALETMWGVNPTVARTLMEEEEGGALSSRIMKMAGPERAAYLKGITPSGQADAVKEMGRVAELIGEKGGQAVRNAIDYKNLAAATSNAFASVGQDLTAAMGGLKDSLDRLNETMGYAVSDRPASEKIGHTLWKIFGPPTRR